MLLSNEAEHFETAKKVQLIYEKTNQYTPPEDAGSDFKILYTKLDEFERNLKEHIHLENNVLFPKAMKLESEIWSLISEFSKISGFSRKSKKGDLQGKFKSKLFHIINDYLVLFLHSSVDILKWFNNNPS